MDISKIISNSIKYPFRNVKRLPILFIPFILIAIIPIGMKFNNNYVIIFGIFTLLLSLLIIPGYLLSIVLKGSVGSSALPSLNLGRNIYDTIRLWFLRIIYMIIPVIAFVVILASFGLTSIDLLFNLQIRSFILTVVVMLLLILLIYVIFEFLLFFAKARLAYFNSLPEALKIHKVISDIRNLGVKKYNQMVHYNGHTDECIFINFLMGGPDSICGSFNLSVCRCSDNRKYQ